MRFCKRFDYCKAYLAEAFVVVFLYSDLICLQRWFLLDLDYQQTYPQNVRNIPKLGKRNWPSFSYFYISTQKLYVEYFCMAYLLFFI